MQFTARLAGERQGLWEGDVAQHRNAVAMGEQAGEGSGVNLRRPVVHNDYVGVNAGDNRGNADLFCQEPLDSRGAGRAVHLLDAEGEPVLLSAPGGERRRRHKGRCRRRLGGNAAGGSGREGVGESAVAEAEHSQHDQRGAQAAGRAKLTYSAPT
jgi:hypothetical protein